MTLQVDVRLVNWEEGGYTVTDQQGPRGEVVIGNRSISGLLTESCACASLLFCRHRLAGSREGEISTWLCLETGSVECQK
jgi:hypothetical protein